MAFILPPPTTKIPVLDSYLKQMHAMITGEVQSLSVPVQGSENHGDHPAKLLTAVESALFGFVAPRNLRDIHAAYVAIIPTTTGTFDWTATATWGTDGEDEAEETDTATADGQAATDDEVLYLEITDALNGGIEAGDLVGVTFTCDVLTDTTGLYVCELLIEYKHGFYSS